MKRVPIQLAQERGGWSNPAGMRLEGGSIGLQIGAGETDLVPLVMNSRGEESLMKSEFKALSTAFIPSAASLE